MISFSFLRERGTTLTVSIKGPEFGSDEDVGRRQSVGDTMGDTTYVYSFAPERRELHLQFADLDPTERADLERFFREVDYSRRWFTVSIPPDKKVPLLCGASIGGDDVLCGDGRLCGEWVQADVVKYRVRLTTPRLTFADPKANARYTVTMALRVLAGFLPDNFC